LGHNHGALRRRLHVPVRGQALRYQQQASHLTDLQIGITEKLLQTISAKRLELGRRFSFGLLCANNLCCCAPSRREISWSCSRSGWSCFDKPLRATILGKWLCVSLLISREKYSTPSPLWAVSTPSRRLTLFMAAVAVSGCLRKMTSYLYLLGFSPNPEGARVSTTTRDA